MNEKPITNHIDQWLAFKRQYVAKRGSDAGPNNKAIPRTTNSDVKQLADYWHNEYLREVMRPLALDSDLASRKRWIEAKRRIDVELAGADPNASYSSNTWFWNDATSKLATYLESRKAVPTKAQLVIESVNETVRDGIQEAKDLASQAGDKFWTAIKAGAVVVGGLVGAAIAIPPIIRAFQSKE